MSQLEIISAFQTRHIMAPLIPEGTLYVGMPMSKSKAQLEKSSFEYGVVREGDRVIGLVAREDLADTNDALPSGSPVKRLELDYLLPEVTPIPELIPMLGVFPFHLVVRGKQVIAVVEVSDLNKHPVYAYLYCKLSLLEQYLADLIEACFPKVEMWRALLPDSRWRQVEARWTQAKANGREVNPVHYLCFSDYMRIVAASPQMLDDLKFGGKAPWQDYVGAMEDLRNDVMHPVRDLVGTHRSAKKLAVIDERIQSLVELTGQLVPKYFEKWVWQT